MPFLQTSAAPLSLQFLQWEKRTPGYKPCPPYYGSLCGSTYSDLVPQELQENLWGSTTGNMAVMMKRGEGCNNQHTDLGRPSNPNQWLCSSAEPSQRCTVTWELGGMQMCLIWILKQGVLPALEFSLPMHRHGAESQLHPL